MVRVWGETPRSLLIKEYFEWVWEWFYDRKALPTVKLLYNFKLK